MLGFLSVKLYNYNFCESEDFWGLRVKFLDFWDVWGSFNGVKKLADRL